MLQRERFDGLKPAKPIEALQPCCGMCDSAPGGCPAGQGASCLLLVALYNRLVKLSLVPLSPLSRYTDWLVTLPTAEQRPTRKHNYRITMMWPFHRLFSHSPANFVTFLPFQITDYSAGHLIALTDCWHCSFPSFAHKNCTCCQKLSEGGSGWISRCSLALQLLKEARLGELPQSDQLLSCSSSHLQVYDARKRSTGEGGGVAKHVQLPLFTCPHLSLELIIFVCTPYRPQWSWAEQKLGKL